MKKILGAVIALLLISCFSMGSAFAFELNENVLDDVFLPVIMYHQVYPKDTNTYRVSPEVLDNDLTELTKQGFTTVLPSEIINFVEGKGSLPQKPVLITFDDGHFNNIFYGEEILKKHNAKAVINVVGSFSDFTEMHNEPSIPKHSYLTWEQIKNIDKNIFEIGNHTYNMHKTSPRFGVSKLFKESITTYKKKINEDVEKMQSTLLEKANIKPLVFAYPFGKYDKRVESYLAESGFKILLTCTEKVNKIKVGDSLPLVLGRFNRSSKYTSEKFVSKIIK